MSWRSPKNAKKNQCQGQGYLFMFTWYMGRIIRNGLDVDLIKMTLCSIFALCRKLKMRIFYKKTDERRKQKGKFAVVSP